LLRSRALAIGHPLVTLKDFVTRRLAEGRFSDKHLCCIAAR
jgi:hypothetical protein